MNVKRRRLGRTGMSVSEVGFGCWQLGGTGWGAVDAREALSAIHTALDCGVNLFDTAPVYGHGRSEELLGRALGGAGEDLVVVSKGGLVVTSDGKVRHDNSRESLSQGVDSSLRRLGRDRIDVFLLHWPDPAVPLEDAAETLRDLHQEGKIGAWGLSNFPVENVLRLASSRVEEGSGGSAGPVLEHPLNLLGEYSQEHQEAGREGEQLRTLAQRCDLGFLAFDVLARGMLGGRYDASTTFGKRDVRGRDRRYRREAFALHLHRVRRFESLAGQWGLPPSALAVRGILELPGVTSCLVGMKTSVQVRECVLAGEVELSREARESLQRV